MNRSVESSTSEAGGRRDADRRSRWFDRYWELYDEIGVRRRGDHVNRMAGALLRYETETREIVALLDGAERAVFYNWASRRLLSVEFDKHGVDESSEKTLIRDLSDPDAWTARYGRSLCWAR
ncbi:hypothetical protein ACFQE1_03515 [Halobium palmae]|uniref:Uncharacterized protein n=1 Tax=Halobium palmae TaxID=1776492 RepID=A0ABD5RVS7_9EURY